MTDEIRIYHVDDPNDAPERRMAAFPTINPFIPLSLPQCVIPPVAGAIQYAMQYWSLYSAYQQGVARGQQQAEQQHRPHEPPQSHYQHHHHHQQQQQHLLHHHHESRLHHHQSHLTPAAPTTNLTPQLNCTQPQHDSPPSLSAASTAQMASSSSSSSSSASTSSSASSIDSGSPQTPIMPHSHFSVNSRDYQEQPRRLHKTPPNQEHIKKPLNPFMIFMQKQRPEIVRQGIIKESAAINQLLGQQWRKLSREEQEPYYKLAEQEKILHAQKYPGWSARDNYANQKKRKKLKLKSISLNGLDQSDKKCRARFGLNNLGSWCKPCKRKKKCIYSIRSNSNTNPMRKLEPNAHNKMVAYQ